MEFWHFENEFHYFLRSKFFNFLKDYLDLCLKLWIFALFKNILSIKMEKRSNFSLPIVKFARTTQMPQDYKNLKQIIGLVTRPGRSWFRPWQSGRTRGVRCRKPVPVEAAALGSDWGSLCTAGSGRRGSCQAAPLGFAGRDQQNQRQLSP